MAKMCQNAARQLIRVNLNSILFLQKSSQKNNVHNKSNYFSHSLQLSNHQDFEAFLEHQTIKVLYAYEIVSVKYKETHAQIPDTIKLNFDVTFWEFCKMLINLMLVRFFRKRHASSFYNNQKYNVVQS
eukprot:TRINITY_DN3178_c0_g1_i2.p7 TRINITY_DN3178_c0_g1~~TRINITY_DN3178_c0_g1_i2.p7  ORF type:complete len:128 (+),score=5.82 TRINITY_DN3178_c0_g1_i2:1159-1542(+)